MECNCKQYIPLKNSAGALQVLMVFRAHPLWCLNFEPVAHQQGSPYPLGHSLPEIKKKHVF